MYNAHLLTLQWSHMWHLNFHTQIVIQQLLAYQKDKMQVFKYEHHELLNIVLHRILAAYILIGDVKLKSKC